jgi:outer membrane protein assembly factor BamE (lipoprotein component of BamABCDE complex)
MKRKPSSFHVKLTLIALLSAPCFLGACADMRNTPQAGMQPWYRLSEQSFAQFKPGASKTEVERTLGRPMNSVVFRNLGEEVWDYRFLNGTRTFISEVHFDDQGRYKYYVTYPDECPMTNTGCRG